MRSIKGPALGRFAALVKDFVKEPYVLHLYYTGVLIKEYRAYSIYLDLLYAY